MAAGALFTPGLFSCRQSPETAPQGEPVEAGRKRRRAMKSDQTAEEDSIAGLGTWLVWLSGRRLVVFVCLF